MLVRPSIYGKDWQYITNVCLFKVNFNGTLGLSVAKIAGQNNIKYCFNQNSTATFKEQEPLVKYDSKENWYQKGNTIFLIVKNQGRAKKKKVNRSVK